MQTEIRLHWLVFFTAQSPIQVSQQIDMDVESIRLIETSSCNNRIELVWPAIIYDCSTEGRGQTTTNIHKNGPEHVEEILRAMV